MASILLLVGLVMAFNSSTDHGGGRQRIEKEAAPSGLFSYLVPRASPSFPIGGGIKSSSRIMCVQGPIRYGRPDAVLFSIWRASEDCEVHDHHKIVWSTQFRLTPGSDDGAGDRGDVHDQFRTAYGIPAKRGCAVIPCGNGKCGCA